MLIQHFLIDENPKSTISAQYINGFFKGFILEDPEQIIKVPGNTRVDGGVGFKLVPTKEGRIFAGIKKVFPYMEFAVVVIPFPRHTGIMFHPGIETEDTRGCFLPGLTVGKYLTGQKKGTYYLRDSRACYQGFYSSLEPVFDKKRFRFTEDVLLDIHRDNFPKFITQINPLPNGEAHQV